MLLKDKRIFIVEDNLENRAIMVMLLEQHGAKTGIERWGKDTVQRLQQFGHVDLILLDLMFPHKITGFDVFANIRAVDEFQHVPIAAVSASDPGSVIPRLREFGFAGFIRKPVDFDLFPQQVCSVIKGVEVWETVRYATV